MLLALAGKFPPEDYVDGRYTTEEDAISATCRPFSEVGCVWFSYRLHHHITASSLLLARRSMSGCNIPSQWAALLAAAC